MKADTRESKKKQRIRASDVVADLAFESRHRLDDHVVGFTGPKTSE